MKTIVFDVPADKGGALTVLEDFYSKFSEDVGNNYIFVISVPVLKTTKNIEVVRIPWIKKSWLHRVYFDYFIAHKLVQKYNADEVISLQNVIIPFVSKKQILFIHNFLPFTNHKFNIFTEPVLWINKNIIGRRVRNSVKKATSLVVQAEWFKLFLSTKYNIDHEKISVLKPRGLESISFGTNITSNNNFDSNRLLFFYPSSGMTFKNHHIIIEAVKLLFSKGIRDFNVIFTLNGDENTHIRSICKEVSNNKLPISFIGYINNKQIQDYYLHSVLIFPSLIETVGLPLLEARQCKSWIIAADLPYVHEVMESYEKVDYFNPYSASQLSQLMIDRINDFNEKREVNFD